jgi:hypothetical protein
MNQMAVKLGKAALLPFLFLASNEYALARAHCSHGEFFRVHLSKCVAAGSRLALDFRSFHRAGHGSHFAQLHDPPSRPLTYVQVIEPEIDIPFDIPSSRLNRQPVVYFRLPK